MKITVTGIETNLFVPINKEIIIEKRSFTDKKTVKLEKSTDKAVLLKVYIEKNRRRGTRVDEFSYWLPKSQIAIYEEQNLIAVPNWLLQKNEHLPSEKIICDLNDEQLREQTGLELTKLTSTDYLNLVQQELAHWQE